jgi:hypothetical protein
MGGREHARVQRRGGLDVWTEPRQALGQRLFLGAQ